MRECYCFNGRVYTKKGFDLSSIDVFYHMNADEQTPYQNDILRALELSGVKVINRWDSFYTAKNKFMTNVLLKNHGMNVIPSLYVNSIEAVKLSSLIFKEWKKICVKPVNKHGGKGIIAFDNEEQFKDFIDATSNNSDSYYVEKFIDFGPHDYRIEIFKNQVVCGSCRHKTHSFKTNISAGGYYVSTIPSKEFEEVALKAAFILGIDTTTVDMIKSKEDNKIYILEVNPIMGIFVESWLIHNDKLNEKITKHDDQKKLTLIVNYLISLTSG
jgi:glutathione synthase/RimK-type ligase-like ATP-grasp enzyme